MDKSSSLGMSPGHPKKYPRGSSVKSWGCPRHPLFINKKHQVIFQCAIFLLLHALFIILGASLFSVVCLLFSIKLDPIIFCFGERHAPLHHIYFGVRYAPPVLHMNALFLLLLFCECSSLLVLCLALSFSLIFFSELVSLLVISSLIFMFIIYESYFIILLAVELEEKKFLAHSRANGSLCRLRHRFMHVM